MGAQLEGAPTTVLVGLRFWGHRMDVIMLFRAKMEMLTAIAMCSSLGQWPRFPQSSKESSCSGPQERLRFRFREPAPPLPKAALRAHLAAIAILSPSYVLPRRSLPQPQARRAAFPTRPLLQPSERVEHRVSGVRCARPSRPVTMSCVAGAAERSDGHSAYSEEKDSSSSNLDISKDSKSEEDSSSESDSDNEEPETEKINGELGESSTEGASAQDKEWEDKELPTDHFNSEFIKIEPHCGHCNAENKHNEHVTPRHLSRGQFLLKLDTEGVYECSETGLIFEVNRRVDIKYCILSWSKYADLVVKPWAVGGPLFDVKCDPTSLTSIQFPHSLCLGRHDADMTFRVLHIKSSGASLECTVDHSATHVKWHMSSLSPMGPVIQSEEMLYHHGAVILYKVVDNNPSLLFRVYIATNNDSFIKDISKSVKHSLKKFMKIDKPPVCQKLLQNGKKYRLVSEPEADITPEEFEFLDGSLLKLKSYIEVYLESPVEFKLVLVEMDSDDIVWKATLRECDWVQHDQSQKSRTGKKRPLQMSIAQSDDEVPGKRTKQVDTSDGTQTLLTDAQLITLAGKLGKEWIRIAIANLELDISDIDAIREKEDDIVISKFRMLKRWQEKNQGNATVQNLYNCLKNVSVEVQDVLEGFL
ncbi:caspase recruitment domain-containing protein 8-like [Saccopteryx bilineata]|uniref:caspase recruitment domain-containing protein 8-like n=1 Tax=Saccopteryx bilineata TaxID=59482 RepID=UPI00338DD4DC